MIQMRDLGGTLTASAPTCPDWSTIESGDQYINDHQRPDFAEAAVYRHDMAPLHRMERQPAERRHDVAVDHAARGALRLRLAESPPRRLRRSAPGQTGAAPTRSLSLSMSVPMLSATLAEDALIESRARCA